MIGTKILFTAPYKVSVHEDRLPPPEPGQLLVRTSLSGISAGTELLIYRGQFPAGLALDAGIEALSGGFAYPLMYGYSAVGEVIELGPGVDPGWRGRSVFAFQPHCSHFLARLEELFPLPQGLPCQEAVFLPNMETAVNLVMDGRPALGERVAVFGQGIVGLLTSALLARFPLADLVALDRYPLRREAALALGVRASLDPAGAVEALVARWPEGADLTFELSGVPEALDGAIAATGFAGRVVIGSWYGAKRVSLDLGSSFHRSRIRLISSQVSSLDPELSGRWTKGRRFSVAWEMLSSIQPSRFITHRFPAGEAAEAYRLLDDHPEEALQVVFTYE